MAKKKKQKKGSITKKKQAKANKRKQLVRKNSALQPKQKKMSLKKLKDNLSKVSTLSFEPELSEKLFDEAKVKEAMESGKSLPDQVEMVVTEEFQAELIEPLKAIEERAVQEKNQSVQMMAKAMIYYMESNAVPAFFNQLVVAIYLKQVAALKGEEPFTEETILEAVEAYETENKDLLEQKAEALSDQSSGEADSLADFDDESDEDEFEGDKFEEVIEAFKTDLKSKGTDEDDIDEHGDNIEVFLEDYLASDKGIENLTDLKVSHINQFLSTWFVNKMNPVDEDIQRMHESLNLFLNHAKNTSAIDEDKFRKLTDQLQELKSSAA